MKVRINIKWPPTTLNGHINLRGLYISLQQYFWANMNWSSKSSKFIILQKFILFPKIKLFHSSLLFLESLFFIYTTFLHLYCESLSISLMKAKYLWEFECFLLWKPNTCDSLSVSLIKVKHLKVWVKLRQNHLKELRDKFLCKSELNTL